MALQTPVNITLKWAWSLIIFSFCPEQAWLKSFTSIGRNVCEHGLRALDEWSLAMFSFYFPRGLVCVTFNQIHIACLMSKTASSKVALDLCDVSVLGMSTNASRHASDILRHLSL